jgi:predicted HD phosphohydrolase
VHVDAVSHAEDDVFADLVAEDTRRRLDLQSFLDLLDQVLGQLRHLLAQSLFLALQTGEEALARILAAVVHQIGHVLAEAGGELVAAAHQLVQLGDVRRGDALVAEDGRELAARTGV